MWLCKKMLVLDYSQFTDYSRKFDILLVYTLLIQWSTTSNTFIHGSLQSKLWAGKGVHLFPIWRSGRSRRSVAAPAPSWGGTQQASSRSSPGWAENAGRPSPPPAWRWRFPVWRRWRAAPEPAETVNTYVVSCSTKASIHRESPYISTVRFLDNDEWRCVRWWGCRTCRRGWRRRGRGRSRGWSAGPSPPAAPSAVSWPAAN